MKRAVLKTRLTQVFFREYCQIFKNTYFEKHVRTAASFINTENFLLLKQRYFLQGSYSLK